VTHTQPVVLEDLQEIRQVEETHQVQSLVQRVSLEVDQVLAEQRMRAGLSV
jgi:hypothetical protein